MSRFSLLCFAVLRNPHGFLLTLALASIATASPAYCAGIVNVQRNGNTLTITGDGAGNRISIYGSNTKLIVTQADYDDGTVIRGTPSVANFSGDLVVNLNGGDDRLTIVQQDLWLNNVTINSGTGVTEYVYLKYFKIKGNLAITTQATKVSPFPGDGSSIHLEKVSVDGTIRINTGSGSDNVCVYPEGDDTPKLKGAVSIDTRDGNDNVNVDINGSGLGASPQIGGALTIRTGAGADKVYLLVKAPSISVDLGDADDYLQAYKCGTQGGAASLEGGSGRDTFKNQGANSSLFTRGITGFEVRY